MSLERENERLERALERIREQAETPASEPRGGFAEAESRRRAVKRAAVVRTASAVAAAAVIAAVAWWVLSSPRGETGAGVPAAAGARTASSPRPAGPSAATRLEEPEGPKVIWSAEPGAEVRALSEREFAVDRGTAWFSVERASGGVSVKTPDRLIVVHGTVFAVAVTESDGAPATRVGVLTGRVEVRDGHEPVSVASGEELPPRTVEKEPLDPAWRDKLASLFPERVATESPPVEAVPPEPEMVVATSPIEAPPVPAPAAAPSREPVAPPPSVATRYVAATEMLRSGNVEAAAIEMQAIADSDPGSPEAGLALIDLGHLCRARLHDAARARAAYEAYLARYPRGALREDARQAYCEILADSGDAAAERSCLEAYLAEFPGGAYALDARSRLGDLASADGPP